MLRTLKVLTYQIVKALALSKQCRPRKDITEECNNFLWKWRVFVSRCLKQLDSCINIQAIRTFFHFCHCTKCLAPEMQKLLNYWKGYLVTHGPVARTESLFCLIHFFFQFLLNFAENSTLCYKIHPKLFKMGEFYRLCHFHINIAFYWRAN